MFCCRRDASLGFGYDSILNLAPSVLTTDFASTVKVISRFRRSPERLDYGHGCGR